jgi:anion-transporting  ArsA/GET3 family ATPase
VIVAGKGGTGKTTVAAALAVVAARTGMSVLIVEIEGKSGLPALFGRSSLGSSADRLDEGIRARTVHPDRALLEYLEDHSLRRISRRLAASGALEVVASAVPGMKDIVVLGKVKQLEREPAADLIIVDAPAAGHAVTFLGSPRGLLDAVRVGPIRKQAQEVVEMLTDRSRCRLLLVTVPEELPVNELVETAFAVEDRVGVALGPVIVNQRVEPPATGGLDGSVASVRSDAVAAGVSLDDDEVEALAAAVGRRSDRAARHLEQCERLGVLLPLPQVYLPFLFTPALGRGELDQLADSLAVGIAAVDAPAPRL